MALTEVQQVAETIKKSNHVLITFAKDYSVDAVASGLALYLVLKKQGKLADLVCDDFLLPNNLKFLPASETISPRLSNLQKFVISLDTGSQKIQDFSYNLDNDKLNIYITPKDGSFSQENVSAQSSDYKYDLIITVDTPDFDSLGKVFSHFTEFFYDTTIINIDHQPQNEHYGQINFTNLNTVASAEIIFNLINELDRNLIDPEIATCLLAGLIAETKSFKTPNVTPKTLDIASQLMSADAKYEAIIKSLYRSKTLSTLNLWGRALARLKSEEGNKLVWSLLTDHDFIEADAAPKDLPEVVEELISFIPGIEIVILIYQQSNQINVLINTFKNHNALYLASIFNPHGSKNLAEFSLKDKTLPEAEKEVIGAIKEKLGQK
jgi:phosphoesterase RecJ-like protein